MSFGCSLSQVFTMSDEAKMRKESEFWSIMFLVIGVASFFANVIRVKSKFSCLLMHCSVSYL